MKIFTLLTFTIAISSPSLLIAAELSGKVTRVLDGDTIEVLQDKTPVRVRLANIDAP
ncbi:TPA: micrococcal nuclease, partial [Salmonella enterica]|nr:micrococcal nuclease [Salmonella enterica]